MGVAEFTWQDTDPDNPAVDVMVRVVAFDQRRDDRVYLLQRNGSDGLWQGRFELPGELRSLYQFCPVRQAPLPRRELTDDEWDAVIPEGIPDPAGAEPIGPFVWGNRRLASILEMPDAPAQPWALPRPGVPRGKVRLNRIGRDWPDSVHIYTPPGHDGGSVPLVVCFDAQAWMDLDLTATFDNLIADGVVAPFAAALVGYAFGPTRVRGLTRPEVHETFLFEELLPQLEFRVREIVLIGQSLGGLAVVSCALRHPGRFAGVVAQSGSFWWPGGEAGELSGEQVIASVGATDTRFWLEAGRFEATLVPGNRLLHRALQEAGAPVSYREFCGGHDFVCWRAGIGDALAALLGS